MTDTHGHGHAEGKRSPYMVVFGALLIFTVASFVVNYFVREGHVGPAAGFVIILGVAICKAVLVATFFMHLNFDWNRLYFMIIPTMVLGTLLVVVLLPDIVLAWHHSDAQHAPTATSGPEQKH